MSTALTIIQTQVGQLAKRLQLDVDPAELTSVLKATAFKGQVSDAQMSALLIVAQQYGLNPWTKELFAFPDPQNGIVPVVSVDGWARIVNERPEFDGIEFEFSGAGADLACTCRIYRKDRNRPTVITEYLAECVRGTKPWQSHPRRMLRHKALIQCGRLAFGFAGIHDADEAERIIENAGPAQAIDTATGEIQTLTPMRKGQAAASPAQPPAAPRAPATGDVTDATYTERPAAPAQPAAPAANRAPADELANQAQRDNIVAKVEALGLHLDEVLSQHDVDSLETMTLGQFRTVRGFLMSKGAATAQAQQPQQPQQAA